MKIRTRTTLWVSLAGLAATVVLSPFHMVDVEAARKVCEYFLN